MNKPVIIGWDVETHRIEQGNLTPKLVVATFAGGTDTFHLVSRFRTAAAPVVTPESYFYYGTDVWSLALVGDAILDFVVTLVNEVVEGRVDKLVAHNGSFDWAVLCNEYDGLLAIVTNLLESGAIADTMVREKLICIRDGNFVIDARQRSKPTRFGLDYLVMTYFRKDISADKKDPNSWRLRYSELDGVPLDEWPQRAINYAIEDAEWARLVYRQQGDVANEVEQTAAAWALHLMACHGVGTDLEAVNAFERNVRAQAEAANQAAIDAGFWKINKCRNCEGTGMAGTVPNLTPCSYCGGLDHETAVALGRYKSRAQHKPGKNLKRLRALITEGYNGHPPLTEKGAVSTSADTLAGSGDSLLIRYAEGAAAQKLLDTYLPILRSGTHAPITSSPNVLVRSGRTSWRGPNFQNPPQKGGFRDCFIPREGKVFASIDYSGLEMTTLAQVCLHFFGYSAIGEAINEGKDLHTLFAGYMLSKEGYTKTYEEWNAIRKDPTHDLYSLIKDRRQRAKAINFGCPGGLGVAALVTYAQGYGVDLSFNQAEDLRNAWFEMWPEMGDYFKMIRDATKMSFDGTYSITQLYSGRVRGDCTYTSGANSYFQGLAADGAKAAMWALYKACYLGDLPDYIDGPCYLTGVRMWAFIHDEFLFEGGESTAHLWAPQASLIMVEEMRKYTPAVQQAAPPALMRRWLKDAEPVYDGAGHLIPWTPKEK